MWQNSLTPPPPLGRYGRKKFGRLEWGRTPPPPPVVWTFGRKKFVSRKSIDNRILIWTMSKFSDIYFFYGFHNPFTACNVVLVQVTTMLNVVHIHVCRHWVSIWLAGWGGEAVGQKQKKITKVLCPKMMGDFGGL